jgi:hypothetical protein
MKNLTNNAKNSQPVCLGDLSVESNQNQKLFISYYGYDKAKTHREYQRKSKKLSLLRIILIVAVLAIAGYFAFGTWSFLSVYRTPFSAVMVRD